MVLSSILITILKQRCTTIRAKKFSHSGTACAALCARGMGTLCDIGCPFVSMCYMCANIGQPHCCGPDIERWVGQLASKVTLFIGVVAWASQLFVNLFI